MRTIFLSVFLFILGLTSASASCLKEVTGFAIDICGDIDKSTNRTVVDADGNVTANVSNIIKKVLGGASTTVNGHVLYETYTGVVHDQLSAAQFNVLDCRQKMVAVAVSQVCLTQPPPPPPPASGWPESTGEQAVDSVHAALNSLPHGFSHGALAAVLRPFFTQPAFDDAAEANDVADALYVFCRAAHESPHF